MSITREFAYASSSRPADGECVWYRSKGDVYDLIRTGSDGDFRYHAFHARDGRYLQAFASWQDGMEWIRERVEAE
ncbi:hypothetical protein ACIBF6_21880 [Streptosporangium amethystogenes]|uniref:hypothetical protein n=1 Tax=Streptosporangium amethystogenes TaxID=2002 RepID=UPI0037972882